jgi:hypothetical protein
MSNLEFFVGAVYETREGYKAVCLKNDGSDKNYPNIMMSLDKGKVWTVSNKGLYIEYSYIESLKENDIIRMLSDEAMEEIITEAILVKNRVEEFRMREKALKEIQDGPKAPPIEPDPNVTHQPDKKKWNISKFDICLVLIIIVYLIVVFGPIIMSML